VTRREVVLSYSLNLYPHNLSSTPRVVASRNPILESWYPPSAMKTGDVGDALHRVDTMEAPMECFNVLRTNLYSFGIYVVTSYNRKINIQ